jgi:KDO2-lipid IV(A) lauroyltransferase
MKKALYYLLYTSWYLLSHLPLSALYVLSNVIFFIVFYVLKYRRRTVWVNVVTSFPELEPEEHKDIERKFYRWFCDYLVENIKLMNMKPEEMKQRLVFKNTEAVDQCINEGQSCAIYLGHLCNWEWITSLPFWVTPEAQCGQLYHPLENKDFDRLLLHIRQRFGSVCIPMNDSLRRILDYKRQGKQTVIGYIADQAPFWWNIHHWCPFLHHDTAVLSGTERIATKLDQAVFYLDVHRVKRGYYEAEFKLLTREPKKMEEFQLTDIYFSELEKSIRRQPECYLWTHDRWKRTRERFDRRFEVIDGKVHEKLKPEEVMR